MQPLSLAQEHAAAALVLDSDEALVDLKHRVAAAEYRSHPGDRLTAGPHGRRGRTQHQLSALERLRRETHRAEEQVDDASHARALDEEKMGVPREGERLSRLENHDRPGAKPGPHRVPDGEGTRRLARRTPAGVARGPDLHEAHGIANNGGAR